MNEPIYTPLTDKERLIRIETLLTSVVESSNRVEQSFVAQLRKIDTRIDLIEKTFEDHIGQDGKDFRQLRYKSLEFIVLAVLGAIIGYLLKQ